MPKYELNRYRKGYPVARHMPKQLKTTTITNITQDFEYGFNIDFTQALSTTVVAPNDGDVLNLGGTDFTGYNFRNLTNNRLDVVNKQGLVFNTANAVCLDNSKIGYVDGPFDVVPYQGNAWGPHTINGNVLGFPRMSDAPMIMANLGTLFPLADSRWSFRLWGRLKTLPALSAGITGTGIFINYGKANYPCVIYLSANGNPFDYATYGAAHPPIPTHHALRVAATKIEGKICVESGSTIELGDNNIFMIELVDLINGGFFRFWAGTYNELTGWPELSSMQVLCDLKTDTSDEFGWNPWWSYDSSWFTDISSPSLWNVGLAALSTECSITPGSTGGITSCTWAQFAVQGRRRLPK